MANIITELTSRNKTRISFVGKQARHLRLTGKWVDWMLQMNDFRDLIIPLRNEDVEYNISGDKKIVRRVGHGIRRKQYQGVSLFIKNNQNKWPPEPIQINKRDLLQLIRAMITLDCPANYCITDSLRNSQLLLAMLWIKKVNSRLLEGKKKPNFSEIFRISLVK